VQDDLALLSRIRSLEPEALVEAHDTYYPAIFGYISFRVGDHDVAEDLTSEVFTRLLSAVREKSAPSNTLRGWLYAVASRVVADHHRHFYRARAKEALLPKPEPAPDPAETVSQRQTEQELHTALKDLTTEQQEVIALRYGQAMPIRQVAETMGKSEGAVKQLQARAIAALSRKLGPRRSKE
jgi:RNA polymerase sigma-70 factor (ECF subfamily)